MFKFIFKCAVHFLLESYTNREHYTQRSPLTFVITLYLLCYTVKLAIRSRIFTRITEFLVNYITITSHLGINKRAIMSTRVQQKYL